MIDLRSDTVTKPSKEMRKVIHSEVLFYNVINSAKKILIDRNEDISLCNYSINN